MPAQCEDPPRPRLTHVAHAWISAPVYAELASEAKRRHVHPDRLAALIIDAAVSGGYLDALLDRQ